MSTKKFKGDQGDRTMLEGGPLGREPGSYTYIHIVMSGPYWLEFLRRRARSNDAQCKKHILRGCGT